MAIAFNLLLHALLVGSLLLFVFGIIRLSLSTSDQIEKMLRIAAVFAGAMVTIGAQEGGVNYADFTVEALAGSRGASAVANVGATLIPALLGAALGFYVVRTLKRSEAIAIRVLGFVGMLATTAFMQVYAAAAAEKGIDLGAAALPNVTFTAGVILTVIFSYDRSKADGLAASGGATNLLTGLLRRGQETGETRLPRFPRQSTSSPAGPQVAPAKDPFDFDAV